MLNRKVNPLIAIVIIGLICAIALLYLQAPPTQFVTVRGISMAPTLDDGQQVLVLSNYLAKYQRGDIVVFVRLEAAGNDPAAVRNHVYIKRIIGLPGDTISVVHGKIWLGGLQPIDQYFPEEVTGYMAPVLLGTDQYFLVGDNVNQSADSRMPNIGPISRKEFVGKMIKAF
jgi:signal peptidase I